MRIISGKHKTRKLFTVEGKSTRPTTDYNRELLFSSYQDFAGKQVLDLFAGTGSFGLEALSRGAVWVDFVEFASPAIAVLLRNIALLKGSEDCHVYRKKVHSYLRTCQKHYDIIFLDPPYDKNLINPSIASIFEHKLLNSEGVLIVEHASTEALNPAFAEHVFKHKAGRTTSFTWLSAQAILPTET